jgi:hypothetical protein
MVSCTARRLSQEGLEHRATVMACGLSDVGAYLDALGDRAAFDGIVSNFGALNCVETLDSLGALVERHLRPGGAIMLGLMGRACAWEAFYFAATGRSHLSRRRRQDGPVNVMVAGVQVPTYYHRIDAVRAAMGPDVAMTSVTGIGVVLPPPYLEARWQALPAWTRRWAAALDRAAAPWPPFNRLGDHVLLHFTKERRRRG